LWYADYSLQRRWQIKGRAYQGQITIFVHAISIIIIIIIIIIIMIIMIIWIFIKRFIL
jgi:hypothetical protein